MKLDVSTMRFQCPICGQPVDIVERVDGDERDAVVAVEPCGHKVIMSLDTH